MKDNIDDLLKRLQKEDLKLNSGKVIGHILAELQFLRQINQANLSLITELVFANRGKGMSEDELETKYREIISDINIQAKENYLKIIESITN
ncbi:MAG: hypothetical protein ACFHWX_10750 [Bacteroidota bacterium]